MKRENAPSSPIRKNDLRPPTSRTKPLPYVEPLGRVRLNFVKVYAPEHGVVLKAHRDNGDNPELYLDLEHPRPEFEQQNGPELHLGVSANFRVEPLRNSKVKPHIDAYLAESEIHTFLQSIIQANLWRSNRFQAPAQSAGRLRKTASFEHDFGKSPKQEQQVAKGGG